MKSLKEVAIRCEHSELVPVENLRPNPKNRNAHPADQIERLSRIIEYQGFRHPIVVSNLSGFIAAGHGRLEAAKRLGLTHVPVDYQDFPDEDAEYAFLTADNAIASWSELDLSGINTDLADLGPDFNLDMLGIKDFVLEPAEKLEPQCDEDEVPEHVEPKAKLGDIYKLGRHRLMCGDSTSIDAVLALLEDTKPDMVFTDPPYGIDLKITYDGAKEAVSKTQSISGDDSVEIAKDAFRMVQAMNIPNQVWFGANYYTSVLPDGHSFLVWDKDHNADYFSGFELAWTTNTGKIESFKHMWQGFRAASERGEGRIHPSQKPAALAEWCFDKFGDPKTVLDLFGGSGSTLIACEKTNRTAYLMELDPKYVSVIIERWCKYTGQEAYLLNADGTQTSWTEIKAVEQ